MAKNNPQPNLTLIRELMTKMELTIKDLAEQIELSRQHLSAVFNHREPMTAKNLDKIAEVLGVPRQSLMTTTDRLLLRRIEQILIRFSLSDHPVEADLNSIMDVAVRFGFIQEVDPWAVNDEKSEGQQQIERIMEGL